MWLMLMWMFHNLLWNMTGRNIYISLAWPFLHFPCTKALLRSVSFLRSMRMVNNSMHYLCSQAILPKASPLMVDFVWKWCYEMLNDQLNQNKSRYCFHCICLQAVKQPNCLSCPSFVNLVICFITSALILQHIKLFFKVLSVERLLSMPSCSLNPKTHLLCFPTLYHWACLFPKLLICFKWWILWNSEEKTLTWRQPRHPAPCCYPWWSSKALFVSLCDCAWYGWRLIAAYIWFHMGYRDTVPVALSLPHTVC